MLTFASSLIGIDVIIALLGIGIMAKNCYICR